MKNKSTKQKVKIKKSFKQISGIIIIFSVLISVKISNAYALQRTKLVSEKASYVTISNKDVNVIELEGIKLTKLSNVNENINFSRNGNKIYIGLKEKNDKIDQEIKLEFLYIDKEKYHLILIPKSVPSERVKLSIDKDKKSEVWLRIR